MRNADSKVFESFVLLIPFYTYTKPSFKITEHTQTHSSSPFLQTDSSG